jgi:Holliday junction resolvase RusA-like endonuclease
MIFTLPYPPSANRYWRHVGHRVVTSAEARAYRRDVGLLLVRVKPIDGQIIVRLDVFRPARRGDLDNSAKVLLDSLRGIAYHDDSQIVELHMRRFEDKERPRVEVEVTLK